MTISSARHAARRLRELGLRVSGARKFECPVCLYLGPFITFRGRQAAQCPRCESLERHRFQALAHERLLDDPAGKSMLHVAPEKFFRTTFSRMFAHYETADLERKDVDHRADLTALPFADGSYDVVYASHVLEHIRDDAKAISEIRRVLRPGGVAILPVPIVRARTLEYEAPRSSESNHVRAPGEDYFDRYRAAFPRVVLVRPSDLAEDIERYAIAENDCIPACYVT